MTAQAKTFTATVAGRDQLAPHLIRLVMSGPGLQGFTSTGEPDEWVGLVVPGQFQSRFYTVRGWDGTSLTLDVVVHDQGLVTEWVQRDCVGEQVTITEPKGSFRPPTDAQWLLLFADLTGLPALARILATSAIPVAQAVIEAPELVPDYLPDNAAVTWTPTPHGGSTLADAVSEAVWPDGPGYLWMAGESAQMRTIRRFCMRDKGLHPDAYNVMGYWRAAAGRQPRAVDPAPIWRAGKAAGKSDAEIWADYDAAQGRQ